MSLRALVGIAISLFVPAVGAAERFSHDDWTRVLRGYVNEEGLVDYAGLSKDRTALDRYLRAIAATSPDTDPGLFPTRDHELAYWINAYNALVFSGVLARGPEEESVWTGGSSSGQAFFRGPEFLVGGKKTNLDDLENEVIRARYRDPRIHAALNCASMGCPRLPRRAFTGDDLDRQLDDAMREFVREERNVRIDEASKTVYLSKIFEWFEEDFTAGGTVVDYVNRYRDRDAKIPAGFDVDFVPYDKRINAQGKPRTVP